MRQTINIFIGNSLTPVCEAVAKHSKSYGSEQQNEYTHFISCTRENDVLSFRDINKLDSKHKTSNTSEIAVFFDDLYGKTITITHTGNTEVLLVTVTVCLFDKEDVESCRSIIEGLNTCDKDFELNVIGLYSDLATLFVCTEAEKKELLNKKKELDVLSKNDIDELLKLKKDTNESINNKFSRFFIFQNNNEGGVGLDLDKNTLIKILGECAILFTESYFDIFPVSLIHSDEITLLGISSLWFNQLFFKEPLLKRTFLYLVERECDVKKTPLLSKAKKIIDDDISILSNYNISSVTLKSKSEIIKDFNEKLDYVENSFNGIINDKGLSLPEKRAMLAMLVSKDDPLFDDINLKEDLPTMDDCMSDAIDLFVQANNKMEDLILDGPKKNGKIYNPIEELKQRLNKIRESQAFIRSSEQRLNDIKKDLTIVEDSKKLLTDDGFTYDNVTYKLQHDVVEKPLKKTYQAKKTNFPKNVDLRQHFSSIRNQGLMGSCASFSSSSIFEYIINEANGNEKPIELSPRFLYYNVCKKNDDGTPIDNGSSFYDNIKSLGENGICVEELCEYAGNFSEAPTKEAIENAKGRLVTEAMNVNINHNDFISALSDGYPIAISLKIFDSFGKGRNGFIFRPTAEELNSTDYGYHAMVICGYNDKNKVYIIRNSWGKSFGDKGYCYIPFSYVEDNKLCSQAVIITGVNCAEIRKTEVYSKDEPNFNMNNKNIEYAVTRIKMEEEKVRLKALESEYKELYENYMKLLSDLSNSGKRKLIEKAAALIETTSSFEDNADKGNTSDSTSKSYSAKRIFYVIFAILSLATVIFSVCLEWNKIVFVIALLGTIVSFLLCLKDNNNKKNDGITNIDNVNKPVIEVDKKIDYKFMLAGLIIDKIILLHRDVEEKHKNMESFIKNLQQWRDEEKKSLQTYNEDIKAPFIALFNKDKSESYFNDIKDDLTKDIWLFKYFLSVYIYIPNKFKENLISKLNMEIDKSYKTISMSKYLLCSESFQYLSNLSDNKKEEWMDKIKQWSSPFGQISGKPKSNIYNCVLIKTEDDTEQENWNNFLKQIYSDIPSGGKISSSLKVIYVQVHEIKLDDMKIMHSDC